MQKFPQGVIEWKPAWKPLQPMISYNWGEESELPRYGALGPFFQIDFQTKYEPNHSNPLFFISLHRLCTSSIQLISVSFSTVWCPQSAGGGARSAEAAVCLQEEAGGPEVAHPQGAAQQQRREVVSRPEGAAAVRWYWYQEEASHTRWQGGNRIPDVTSWRSYSGNLINESISL